MESMQPRTPPPFAERQAPSTPIIFRTKNTEKSHLERATIFRTKNTAKSQPTLGRKKFRKKFAGKCFGGKGKPPILWRGGEVLKYERLIYVCKDSGIIRECKRIVLSFCFRTKEPCLCLVGRCLYVLPSFGT